MKRYQVRQWIYRIQWAGVFASLIFFLLCTPELVRSKTSLWWLGWAVPLAGALQGLYMGMSLMDRLALAEKRSREIFKKTKIFIDPLDIQFSSLTDDEFVEMLNSVDFLSSKFELEFTKQDLVRYFNSADFN